MTVHREPRGRPGGPAVRTTGSGEGVLAREAGGVLAREAECITEAVEMRHARQGTPTSTRAQPPAHPDRAGPHRQARSLAERLPTDLRFTRIDPSPSPHGSCDVDGLARPEPGGVTVLQSTPVWIDPRSSGDLGGGGAHRGTGTTCHRTPGGDRDRPLPTHRATRLDVGRCRSSDRRARPTSITITSLLPRSVGNPRPPSSLMGLDRG